MFGEVYNFFYNFKQCIRRRSDSEQSYVHVVQVSNLFNALFNGSSLSYMLAINEGRLTIIQERESHTLHSIYQSI